MATMILKLKLLICIIINKNSQVPIINNITNTSNTTYIIILYLHKPIIKNCYTCAGTNIVNN